MQRGHWQPTAFGSDGGQRQAAMMLLALSLALQLFACFVKTARPASCMQSYNL